MSSSCLWNVKELADFLHVRPLRVYELVNSGQIPFTRIGVRQLRFDPVAIREWLAARTTLAQGRPSRES